MVKLSERMLKIVSFIGNGEIVGDIGTDHAYIPIFLWQNNITKSVVVADLNKGPLEKARENISKEIGENPFDMRLSDGLRGIVTGEVDTVVIAGMGGVLIRDILAFDIEKTRSIKKIILQPRGAEDKLREWIYENGFVVTDAILAEEGKYICEVFCIGPAEGQSPQEISFEITPILIEKKDPLLPEFIKRKLEEAYRILEATKNIDLQKHEQTKTRIEKLEMIEKCL